MNNAFEAIRSAVEDEVPAGCSAMPSYEGGTLRVHVVATHYPHVTRDFSVPISERDAQDTDFIAARIRGPMRAASIYLTGQVAELRRPVLEAVDRADIPGDQVAPLQVPVLGGISAGAIQLPKPKPRDQECPKCGGADKSRVQYIQDDTGPGDIRLTCLCGYQWTTAPLDAQP